METFETKEQTPEFTIKISTEASLEGIIKKLSDGDFIEFIATKSQDLWLSNIGHDSMTKHDGIDWEDVTVDGHCRIETDQILTSIFYGYRGSNEVRSSVKQSLAAFVKNNRIKSHG